MKKQVVIRNSPCYDFSYQNGDNFFELGGTVWLLLRSFQTSSLGHN